MKSRDTILSKADSNECKQTCSACTYCQAEDFEEIRASFDNTKQLYATEAEEYFFYFLPLNDAAPGFVMVS